MVHLIDKDALVAEIENIRKHYIERDDFDNGWNFALNKILSFLDTLEVKGVDIEREMQAFATLYLEPLKVSDSNIGISITMAQLYRCAKHFFDLGIRVNNPITATDRGTAEEIIINLKRVEKDYRINLTKEIEWVRNQVKK